MTAEIPLGRATANPDQYAPELLYAIARTDSRQALGLDADLPFQGVDLWNAWELTWLDAQGLPQIAVAQMAVPAESPNIVESKSLKLYLNSFAMTSFDGEAEVSAAIRKDLSACVDANVKVTLLRPADAGSVGVSHLPGKNLDTIPVTCTAYEVDPAVLTVDENEVVSEELHSHLLRSLCPVTKQPDMGSILIRYEGPRIAHERLLRYIVSFRQHQDFHEACVERMFIDIRERCEPEKLTVYARYQRRGGIDINPLRSNCERTFPNARLWRQ